MDGLDDLRIAGQAPPQVGIGLGIGRAKAEKIWYRALTTYFTSSTNFSAARAATLKAAADLYGGTAGAEAKAVAAVWTAVGVN